MASRLSFLHQASRRYYRREGPRDELRPRGGRGTEEWHRQGLLDERRNDDTTRGASVSRFPPAGSLVGAAETDLLGMRERKGAGFDQRQRRLTRRWRGTPQKTRRR